MSAIPRRKYLVDKRFQGSMIVKMCLWTIMVTLIVVLLVLKFNSGSTTIALEHSRVVVKNTADFILPLVGQAALLVVLVSAITIAVAVLMVTHRVSGPAYRLRKEVEALNRGLYNSVSFKLRARDELKDLARALAILTATLKKRQDYLKAKTAELKEAIAAGDNKAVNLIAQDIESQI